MILVSMPYHGCPQTVRRAVLSVLGQSYRRIRLLVLNDGDDSSHAALEGITDERLFIHDLKTSRGRYFADAIALEANPYPYFSPHDADDWSERTRLEMLRRGIIGHDACFSNQVVHDLQGNKVSELYHDRLKEPLTENIRHFAHHHALFTTEVLRGLYHPGFRIGYDTLLTNLVRIRGKVRYLKSPLYHRVGRADSLSRNEATRWGSPARQAAFERITDLYRKALAEPSQIPDIIKADIPKNLRHEVTKESVRLQKALPW